jgi:zinc protease
LILLGSRLGGNDKSRFSRRIPKTLLGLILAWLIAPLAWAGLDIQHWTTSQGGRVYFVENHDLPMLDLAVAFDAGSARDTPAKSGLAGMTRAMMAKGAGAWSEQEIAERLADVGAVLSGTFDADRAGFGLRTLSSPPEREPALAVLRAILSSPHFPDVVLEREKDRAIAGLKEAATKPDYLAEKAYQSAIFGRHPYALQESGEEETLPGLTRGDLDGFYRQYYRAQNMVVALMGDISRSEAERIAEELANCLPPGPAPAALPPVAVPVAGSEQVLPHHATQSHILVGMPGMKREDPDYFPLLVGNYVLGGGGFDSRMLIEIRQKRGLAYSAYSYFSPMRELGPFQIGLQTKRESTDEALRVLRETLARFVSDGPTEDELAQAKNNLVGSFPLRLDSNKKILDHLAMIGFYRLPMDWLDTYTKRVEAVTRADVLRAFQARVRLGAMSTVIVGGQPTPPAK